MIKRYALTAMLFSMTCLVSFGQERKPLTFDAINALERGFDKPAPEKPARETPPPEKPAQDRQIPDRAVIPQDQPLFDLQSRVNGLAVSYDGRYLAAVCESGTLAIWDFESGKMHAQLQLDTHPLYAVAFHFNRNIVAFGGAGAKLHVLDLDRDLRINLEGTQDGTTSLTFFGEGIAAGGSDGTVRFFHPNISGVVIGKERHRGKITSLTTGLTHGTKHLPQGSTIVVSVDDGGSMRLWNDGNHVLQKKSGGKDIHYARFADRMSTELFMVTGTPRRAGWLKLGLKDEYRRVCNRVRVLESRRVPVRNCSTRRVVYRTRIVPTTKTFCTINYNGTSPVLKETPTTARYNLGDMLALSPDGYQIASVKAPSIEIWDLWDQAAQPPRQLACDPNEPIDSMIWTVDSLNLITASPSGVIRVLAAN